MDRPPQHTRAFPMYYSPPTDALTPAGLQIVRQQFFHIFGIEGMQVKGPVNRELNRIYFLVLAFDHSFTLGYQEICRLNPSTLEKVRQPSKRNIIVPVI